MTLGIGQAHVRLQGRDSSRAAVLSWMPRQTPCDELFQSASARSPPLNTGAQTPQGCWVVWKPQAAGTENPSERQCLGLHCRETSH